MGLFRPVVDSKQGKEVLFVCEAHFPDGLGALGRREQQAILIARPQDREGNQVSQTFHRGKLGHLEGLLLYSAF